MQCSGISMQLLIVPAAFNVLEKQSQNAPNSRHKQVFLRPTQGYHEEL